MLEFPRNFYWGSATSAHQVEGGNVNDWSEWEKENAERLARKAKVKWQKWQQEKFPEMFKPENYVSGRACDHYHLYEKDFNIAKKLGHNAHRFSIEWSRVEPEQGKFNEKEINHYRKVILALRQRGIEPFVTLWHWTNPLWIRDLGGWENKETIKYFIRYLEKIIDSLGSCIKFWMPLNEPGSFVGMAYIRGDFPPQKRNLFLANKVFKNLMEAYQKAYQIIHKKQGGALIGISHYAVYCTAYKNLPWNYLLMKIVDYIRNWRFLNSIDKFNDFVGIQYYNHDIITLTINKGNLWGFIDTRSKNKEISDMGWGIYPKGIYYLLKKASKYKKPIYITENGLADAGDTKRAAFIKEHLKWIHKAIQEGVDVRGYFYWSLLDNFEWDKGFWPRFGLAEIDYKTLKRRVRPSAWEYKKIIEDSAIGV